MSYEDVKAKLYHGHRKVANNTYLDLEEDWSYDPIAEMVVMRLHGNIVAGFYPNHLELYSAGWHTSTTKDRLNLALQLASINGGVRQEDWTWFLDIHRPSSSQMFYDGMKLAYDGKVIG